MASNEGTSSKPNDYLSRLEPDGDDGNEFIDRWDTDELLFLASSVVRSDRNCVKILNTTEEAGDPFPYDPQVSVSRLIRQFGEQTRPSEWYTPKNCALQYTKLLSEIEEDSKKKTLPRTERETPEVMLVKNLTEKRLRELEWLNQQTKASANVLKTYMEMVNCGDLDEDLDDLLIKFDEAEKLEVENYNQYVSKRDNLLHKKKLNKSRVIKGKAVTKVLDPKKKISLYPDLSDDSRQSPLKEVTKKEIISDDKYSKPAPSKSEIKTPITLNALLDTKVTTPSESPLLTSLLRSIASTTSVSPSVSSPLKEVKTESQSQQASPSESPKIDVFLSPTKLSCAGISPLLTSLLKSAALPLPTHNTSLASKESDLMDDSSKSDMEKSTEASPRSSVPPSPRASAASSPMLNSLLKNSPSSTTSIEMSPVKETSPKIVSSPQSFFNPTSALATAAGQQLAVATSTALPPGLQFFQQHDLLDSRKVTLRTSPATSACLSAPTLSKLLEMPPSSPGKLPPLSILDPPITPTPPTTPSTEPRITPKLLQSSPTQQQSPVTKQPIIESPSKKVIPVAEPPFFADSPVTKKSSPFFALSDRKSVSSEDAKPVPVVKQKAAMKPKTILDVSQKDSATILEEITESFNQAFEVMLPAASETKKENLDDIEVSNAELELESCSFETEESVVTVAPMIIKQKPVSPSNIEEIVTSDPIDFQTLPFQDASEPKILSTSNTLFNPEQVINIEPGLQESIPVKHSEVVEDDKGSSGRKFYKSRTPIKNQDALEKAVSETPILQSPKKTIFMKIEPDTSTSVISSDISSPIETEVTVSATEKNQDSKNLKSNDARSPVSKKPRLHERSSTEKAELSEDDIPSTIRRSGRRGKKGCGRTPKSTPVKQSDPKDQYEFSESTEENSVCYPVYIGHIARSKEESRLEDLKLKSAQDSEDAPSNASSPTEKKLLTPTRSKQGKTPVQAISVRKSLFTSDEERMSDSVTSDEASNHQLSEDKLKKWEETCEKKGDIAKTANESLKRLSKALESPKKKSVADKRNSSGKSIPGRKERKISSPDMEDLSAGSRDSEEMSSAAEKEASEEKIIIPPISLDMEVETNDSQLSSSNAAESDKQTEDNEESLQGSTDFSSPATAEIKDEKETPQFGKQDWLQGVSPKSSEPISQSSEESEEYESDNWDNQSVSTNKSASQSTEIPSRLKRKERETPEYKAWKKAISIVLREASCHKNANIFRQKVTDDVAPGYLSIVHRPMDLSLIKKNIDNGVIRTTEEFHRDMLIMFQNAIMYNSSDHDVHQMAVEMQQDVLEQIAAFVLTQANDKNEVSEPVSNVRGTRKSQKGKQTSSSIKVNEETDKD